MKPSRSSGQLFDVWQMEDGRLAVGKSTGHRLPFFGVFNHDGLFTMHYVGTVESDSLCGAYTQFINENPEYEPGTPEDDNRYIQLIGGYIVVGLVLAGIFAAVTWSAASYLMGGF